MRKALTLSLLLTLTLPGCALLAGGKPIVTASGAGCSTLTPGDWRKRVEPAPLPEEPTVGAWIAAFDAQTSRLDMQWDRLNALIGLYERCEARDEKALAKAAK